MLIGPAIQPGKGVLVKKSNEIIVAPTFDIQGRIQQAAISRGHGPQTAASSAGAGIGAALGSFFGPLGAVYGAAIGAAIGYASADE